MATGRIGVTPTLRTRWSKAPSAGTTSLSGLDDNSVSLVYDVGYEAVYRNGVLLSRTNDYTATTGNSITLIDATIAGDIIEVFANQLLPLTNAIGNGQYTDKGALLSATAASTPAVLTVGSNDQVLTADSSTATGLKWATPSSGGMTLLSTTALTSGSTATISSINQSYKNLYVIVRNMTSNNGSAVSMRFNGDTGSNYIHWWMRNENGGISGNNPSATTNLEVLGGSGTGTAYTNLSQSQFIIPRYAETEYKSFFASSFQAISSYNGFYHRYYNWNNTAAITSISFSCDGGNFTAGNIFVYGVS